MINGEAGEEAPLNEIEGKCVPILGSPGAKLQFPRQNLEALRTLGSSTYGNVFLAKATDIVEGEGSSIVVVQSLTTKDEKVKKEFMKTMEMLSLKHENIAKLLGQCEEEEPMYVISEYPEQVSVCGFYVPEENCCLSSRVCEHWTVLVPRDKLSPEVF